MTVSEREIRTKRLHMRPAHQRDAEFIGALIQDESVRRYLGGPITADRLESSVAQYIGAEAVWIVTSEPLRRRIGVIGLAPYRDGQSIELSYQFHPHIWGKGYASEAAQAVLDTAYAQSGAARLVAETQSANAPSRRLLERLGWSEVETVMRFGAAQSIYRPNR